MKILERVVEARVMRIVRIDDMQFGYKNYGRKMCHRFIFGSFKRSRPYVAWRRKKTSSFVDLERAFGRVPR